MFKFYNLFPLILLPFHPSPNPLHSLPLILSQPPPHSPSHPLPIASTLSLSSSPNPLHTLPLILSQPPPHFPSHPLPTPSTLSLSSSPNPLHTPPLIVSQSPPHSPSHPLPTPSTLPIPSVPHTCPTTNTHSYINMAGCMLKLKQLHSLCSCTIHIQHTLMSCPNHTRTCGNSSAMRKRGKPFNFMFHTCNQTRAQHCSQILTKRIVQK